MLGALLGAIRGHPDLLAIADRIRSGVREQLVTGLAGSTRAIVWAALQEALGRPLVILSSNNYQAQKNYEDIVEIVGEDGVVFYPGEELVAFVEERPSAELAARLEALYALLFRRPRFLVTGYAALMRPLPPPAVFRAHTLELKPGDERTPEDIVRVLVRAGYRREAEALVPGTVAVRGGIVDVYPLAGGAPVRLEWGFDALESIRAYDPEDGRSRGELPAVRLLPASTFLLASEARDRLLQALGALRTEETLKIGDPERRAEAEAHLDRLIAELKAGGLPPEAALYLRRACPEPATLLDFLEAPVLAVDEPSRVWDAAAQYAREEAEWIIEAKARGRLVGSGERFFSREAALSPARAPIVYFSFFARTLKGMKVSHTTGFVSRSGQAFHGQFGVLKTEFDRWRRLGYRVLFLAGDRDRAERLQKMLEDAGMAVDVRPELVALPEAPAIAIGHLETGFEWPSARLVVVTEGELFTQRKRRVRPAIEVEGTERIARYQDLKPGNYVVHVHHGIGRFVGLETLEVDGVHRDYLRIQYAGGDQLYVPVDQLGLIQKYAAADDREPKLSKLGSGEWKKTKQKVRQAVEEMARKLLELYARRAASPGFAFPPDDALQKEFEALFPYEPTPDQLRAIEEIKRDMESPRPMDRLLCGDVGYGKTEVALRAAFKAVMAGKQVAFLVPTTILAEQHYQTIKERMADFPVTVEVLSRFRTRAEQKDILARLKRGEIDIIVGTHRLLSKDVVFHDLGLLIVDEEQRFGVRHKERLKELKANVDVLTLTATPIPRTLNMALIGLRDLSLIETPPENRYPVQTIVAEYSPTLVREAIERELARGGQVFFLYNYVESIYRMAEEIRALVPEATVAVAHGKMPEDELERTMLDFMHGEIDVLVTTTIIETGVDIPNANTLIVYDADRFGLAQLYQLRGRVGRSGRIAYAYLTYQKGKVFSEEAERRLEAIKEFTELGSGFKIAMRDLAIRGAGNLLGPEQHGFIAAVGFDLYNEMLREAVQKLKGEPVEEAPKAPELNVQIDAYLPEDYIPLPPQKIGYYKRLAAVRDPGDVEDVRAELRDRFGPLPAPAERLLLVARVRALGTALQVERIDWEGGQLSVRFRPEARVKADDLLRLARAGERLGLSVGTALGFFFKAESAEAALRRLEALFVRLAEALSASEGKGVLRDEEHVR
ncbi:transcription-repair coupling factor [Hydrogenibacillus schlegelii]|uniref:transcription-repair coupling factor n=1 Tax=Hydrogenibacillus schlegelii TaxID=1484 RepID=UPI0007911106|nr:transcription-repair coupling factor [Hydrogenibacillus schlegelii]KWX03920.1 transcription-repair coupling factor [Hydrogenibacillus schlegelii]